MIDDYGQSKLEIDVRLELRDYLRASYWFLFRKWSIKALIALALFMVMGFLFVFIQRPNASALPMLILPTLVLFVIGSVYFGAKRNLASNKSVQENIHYTFSNRGVNLVAESSSGQTAWSNIVNAFETKHNFLLFVSRSIMQIIPKRCFQDSEQIAEFKQMLVSNLDSKAKLK